MKTPFMRRIVLPVGIILVAMVVFIIMVKMRPQPHKQRPPRPHPVVSVMTVGLDDHPIRLTGYGTVQAKLRIDVIPQVNGRIAFKSPFFEAGETIAQGDTLIRIEETDYLQGRAQAQANLAQMQLNLALAEQSAQVAREEWNRLQGSTVPGEDTPEPSPLVLQEPQLNQARAAVAAAEATLDLAQANLDRCTLTAPFSGRVLSADVDAGQYLRAGNPVGSLYALEKAEVVVPLPAEDMSWIKTGANPGVDPYAGDRVTIVAEYAGQEFTWAGYAARLGGAIDKTNRQVPVVVEIDDPFVARGDRPALLTGMFVTAVFEGAPPAGAVVIPREALRPGNKVWVITPERTITIRPVQVARAGTRDAVITDGLAPGEMICTSNLQFVTEGLPIRIQGEKNGPAKSRGSASEPVKGEDR